MDEVSALFAADEVLGLFIDAVAVASFLKYIKSQVTVHLPTLMAPNISMIRVVIIDKSDFKSVMGHCQIRLTPSCSEMGIVGGVATTGVLITIAIAVIEARS